MWKQFLRDSPAFFTLLKTDPKKAVFTYPTVFGLTLVPTFLIILLVGILFTVGSTEKVKEGLEVKSEDVAEPVDEPVDEQEDATPAAETSEAETADE